MEFIDVGRIANSHGVRGDIKVIPFSSDMKLLKNLKHAYIRMPVRKHENTNFDLYEIAYCKQIKNAVVLKLFGVTSVEEAQQLIGRIVCVDKSVIPDLPKDTFYYFDLIGCSVFNVETGDLIGRLEDVLETGANDVYSVKDESGRDILIPALKEVICKVDIKEKIIQVKLPNGLMDIYTGNTINDDI